MQILFLSTKYADDSNALASAAVKAGYDVRRLDYRDMDQVAEALKQGHSVSVFLGWLWSEALMERGVHFIQPSDRLLFDLDPASELRRAIKETSLGQVKTEHQIFIKPLNGKEFDGQVVDQAGLDFWLSVAGDIPVIQSEVVEIVSEYRFFVLDKQVVAASFYKGEAQEQEAATALAETLAKRVATHTYALDIGLMKDGSPLVIEANPVHQSGIYQADPHAILPCLQVSLAGKGTTAQT